MRTINPCKDAPSKFGSSPWRRPPVCIKGDNRVAYHHLQLSFRFLHYIFDRLQPLSDTCNMDYRLVLLIALTAVALARPQDKEYPSASYKFDYRVHDEESGNNFGQSEGREGDNTQGSYDVVLPDGKKLVVSYTVNEDGGFVAGATIDGVPLHQV